MQHHEGTPRIQSGGAEEFVLSRYAARRLCRRANGLGGTIRNKMTPHPPRLSGRQFALIGKARSFYENTSQQIEPDLASTTAPLPVCLAQGI
jgi:hypothetical protein